ETERGHLRRDLDPALTVVSLISLALFPFVSLPITSRVLGVETNEAGLEKLIAHTLRLFQRGVAAEGASHA
ncbi:MAG TPA: hypothetical protein VFX94_11270, partial [Burkholderiales bacterium]|nr:hypothetical protein [Burkholderiales bacterium]